MDPYIFWTLLALGFLILELFLPAAFSFLFTGLACVLTGLICFSTSLPWSYSIGVFVVLTCGLLAFVHKRYRSHWAAPHGDEINNTLSRLVNSSGLVTSIDGDQFKIRIGGYYWSAKKKTKDCKIVLNSMVRVVGYEQMTLLVSPIEPPKGS